MLFYFALYTGIGFAIGYGRKNAPELFTIACIAGAGGVLYTLAIFPPVWALVTLAELFGGYILANMFINDKQTTTQPRSFKPNPYTPTPTPKPTAKPESPVDLESIADTLYTTDQKHKTIINGNVVRIERELGKLALFLKNEASTLSDLSSSAKAYVFGVSTLCAGLAVEITEYTVANDNPEGVDLSAKLEKVFTQSVGLSMSLVAVHLGKETAGNADELGLSIPIQSLMTTLSDEGKMYMHKAAIMGTKIKVGHDMPKSSLTTLGDNLFNTVDSFKNN